MGGVSPPERARQAARQHAGSPPPAVSTDAPAPARSLRVANLRDHLVLLVRRLRAAGLHTGPGDAVTALAALEHVDLGDPLEVRAALRIVLARRREELPVIDRVLDAFFWGEPVTPRDHGPAGAIRAVDPAAGPGGADDGLWDLSSAFRDAETESASDGRAGGEGAQPTPSAGDDRPDPGEGHPMPGEGTPGRSDAEERADAVLAVLSTALGNLPATSIDRGRTSGTAGDPGDHPSEASAGGGAGSTEAGRDPRADEPGSWRARAGGGVGGYSPLAVLTRRDVQLLDARDRQVIMTAARHVGRWLATRPSRRFVRAGKGAIDGRRALREAARKAGDLVRWPRRRRRPGRLRLVGALDVSGSMDVYSQLFLHFLYSLQQGGGRVETFAIGTRLTRLTTVLRTPRPEVAIARAAAVTVDWSGGTRLGECLWALAQRFGHLLDRDTVLLVISDGLDRGDLALLDRAIRACRRRVGALVWLNPLAGDPRYEPRSQGMQVALPYVDVLAPAHNLESLVRLARWLRQRSRRLERHRRTNRPGRPGTRTGPTAFGSPTG